MNYYEKIIQEKQNGNLFLERLKTKSFRSADELERAIKSYVAGGRVISDDADGFTVEAIEDDGKHTYKIYLREDGGTSERVTVEKVVKLNSKGETDMGYYADLIKQKQEKRNFRADPLGFGPTVVGMGTPDDYKAKFKVGDKVKFYSGEGVIVKGPIKMRFSLTPTYHIKVTKGKEAGREVSRYEEELKKNSKEERDNDSEGRLMEIAEKVLREYPESTKSYAKFEDRFLTKAGWGYNPSKVKTIKEIWERVANSKEEKDNSLIGLFEELRPKDEKTVKEYIRQVKNFIRQCEAKSERSDYAKDYRDLNKRAAESYKKDVEKAERWLSEHRNSDEEKGYYAKLAAEKQERKNYKFTDKEISDYLKSNPSQAKQYVRKKTAGKAENITIHPESLTAELDENGKTHLFKFVSDESLGFILKYMGTK